MCTDTSGPGPDSLRSTLLAAEKNRRTGTLKVFQGKVEKRFYFHNGELIWFSSEQKGERVGEFLAGRGCLDLEEIDPLVAESRRRQLPFTWHLLKKRRITRNDLEDLLGLLAVTAMLDVLAGEECRFEFFETLPPEVITGPIKLKISIALCRDLTGHGEDQEKWPSSLADHLAHGKRGEKKANH